jgi:hypothetical protein
MVRRLGRGGAARFISRNAFKSILVSIRKLFFKLR